jgi:hypothetical protein
MLKKAQIGDFFDFSKYKTGPAEHVWQLLATILTMVSSLSPARETFLTGASKPGLPSSGASSKRWFSSENLPSDRYTINPLMTSIYT